MSADDGILLKAEETIRGPKALERSLVKSKGETKANIFLMTQDHYELEVATKRCHVVIPDIASAHEAETVASLRAELWEVTVYQSLTEIAPEVRDSKDVIVMLRSGAIPGDFASDLAAFTERLNQGCGLLGLFPVHDPVSRPRKIVRGFNPIETDGDPSPFYPSAGLVFAATRLSKLCSSISSKSDVSTDELLYAFLFLSDCAGGFYFQEITLSDIDLFSETLDRRAYNQGWYFQVPLIFKALLAGPMTQRLRGLITTALVRETITRLNANRNTANKMVLRDEELNHYIEQLATVYQTVSMAELLKALKVLSVPVGTRYFLLTRLCQDRKLVIRPLADDIEYSIDDIVFARISQLRFNFAVMEIHNQTLEVVGRLGLPIPSGTHLRVRIGNAVSTLVPTDVETGTRFFGIPAGNERTYKSSIEVPSGNSKFTLKVELCSSDDKLIEHLPIRFLRPSAHLANRSDSYWQTNNLLVTHTRDDINFEPVRKSRVLWLEARLMKHIIGSNIGNKRKIAFARLIVVFQRLFLKSTRPTWIYYDKLYKGGDNGEYAFRFARKQDDDIKKYYLLDGKTPTGKRFRKERIPYLQFGTVRAMVHFLNADLILGTHINPQNFGGFHGPAEAYVRDLFKFDFVSIQHGLSVQELSGTLNKYFDNTKRYFIAGKPEETNLLKPSYGYISTDLVRSGLARFDGLAGSTPDKHPVLLISPTWRTYLAGPYNMGKARSYNPEFKSTHYFEIYQALINNPRLLAAARTLGYRIVLLLHPVTSSQEPDFTYDNSIVDVVPTTGEFSYEEALRSASILVTDFSGIQFDFASMGRQVVYFQPPELPASYDLGAYQYGEQALGEVRADIDSLVALLLDLMADDPTVSRQLDRIEDFFFNRDGNNSARIYEGAFEYFQSRHGAVDD